MTSGSNAATPRHCVCGACSLSDQAAAHGPTAVGKNAALRARQSVGPFFAHEIGWPMEHHLPLQTVKNSFESADSNSLRSFAPAVPMMKAAKPGSGNHSGSRRRSAGNGPPVRRVLIQGIVNPILVVVVHVIPN